jgi:carbon-monoxide dehydrogenase medium subunit
VKPARFAYAAPDTIEDALELLAEHGDEAKILAGGQSLMPLMNFRLVRPSIVVDINRLNGLNDIAEDPDGTLRIGALVRQRHLERWTAARPTWGMLHRALSMMGHLGIRTRGTIGGSLAHADPASELPAILLVHDGVVVAWRRGTRRTIRARELFKGPLTTSLHPDELVVEVRLPNPHSGATWAFEEVARRHGDFALVGIAAMLTTSNRGVVEAARLAVFGVGGTAVRVASAEDWLRGRVLNHDTITEAARIATQDLDPQTDLQATAAYRKRVAQVLLQRALTHQGGGM